MTAKQKELLNLSTMYKYKLYKKGKILGNILDSNFLILCKL